jgi:D-alanine-D-alanine ligase
LGVARANNLSELAQAIECALGYDSSVLVERFIEGKEVAVGILDGRVLGAIEISPRSGLYDFEAKYTPGMTDYFMPARLPAARYRGVLNLAERAAQALDTSGAVRVDLRATEGQNEYVLEVNTLPGMTETSLLPKIARAAGFGFAELCEAILERATLHTGTPQRNVEAEAAPAVAAYAVDAEEQSVVRSRRRQGDGVRSQRSRTA